MTREMWMLNQLAGTDMPLPLMVDGFGSSESAQRAVASLHAHDVIELFNTESKALPAWRVAELCRLSSSEWETQIADLRIRMTDHGLRKYPGLA